MATFIVLLLLISSTNDATSTVSDQLSSNDIIREDYKTLGAHMNAATVTHQLRNITNRELGIPFMQSIIDNLSFDHIIFNRSKIVEQYAERIDQLFEKYTTVLDESQIEVHDYYSRVPLDMRVFRAWKECCRIRSDELKYDEQFGHAVNTSFACDILSPQLPTFGFYPGKNLTASYQRNAANYPGIRWQYFIGAVGSHIEYPANSLDSFNPWSSFMSCAERESIRHRAVYISAALPYPKRVVILLDYGTISTQGQLARLKMVAKLLLESFSINDRITVLAASSTVVGPCESDSLQFFDVTALHKLSSFIDNLSMPDGRVNYSHSLGFEESFRALINAESLSSDIMHSFIMYVSRGLLSTLAEAGHVLSTIANLNMNTMRVQINTFAIMDEDKIPLLWSTQFMRDIAEQNFEQYYSTMNDNLRLQLSSMKITPPKGKLVLVNDSELQTITISRVYELLKKPELLFDYQTKHLSWSAPILTSGHIMISIAMAVWFEKDFIGIVGNDINIDTIADWIKYADFDNMPQSVYNRVILCDYYGRIIIESKMRKSFLWPQTIADIEGWKPEDRWRCDFTTVTNRGRIDIDTIVGNMTRKMRYDWIKLKHAPYVMILASDISIDDGQLISVIENRNKQIHTLQQVIYHRLDLQLNTDSFSFCKHVQHLSTVERGAIFLSPTCFTSPYKFLYPYDSNWRIQSNRASGYWVYLGDSAGLIRNTGVRLGVREHVGILASIINEWRRLFINSSYRKHIIRRFVATNRGVMVVFPATVVNDEFDPTERQWYKKAVKYPGRIIITGPYIDASVGEIVTISHAMYLSGDKLFAVMGMDVTIDFIYKILRDALPTCKQIGRRCLLFDDGGYVIGRSDLYMNKLSSIIEREPIESSHLSHREPSLAIYLLQNEQFMQKISCRKVDSDTIERRYRINITYADAIRMTDDSIIGCTRAEVIPVPNTNIFLAQLDHGCSSASISSSSTFCPCSINDRRCLLCTRVDPIECECPCECAIKSSSNICQSSMISISICDTIDQMDVDSLSLRNERNSAPFIDGSDDKHLSTCLNIRCDDYGTIDECLGIIGCQWCVRTNDGNQLLTKPFCTNVEQCFRGISGRSISGSGYIDESFSSMSTPVGPVAGAIMGMFVVLVIVVYCYRHHVGRLVEGRNNTSGMYNESGGTRLCGATLDDDNDNEYHFDHDGSKADEDMCTNGPIKSNNTLQLASFERNSLPTTTAPYHRGPRTESSDHGYSTMTDRMAGDDSERGTQIDSARTRPTTKRHRYDSIDDEPLLVTENNDDDIRHGGCVGSSTVEIVVIKADVHAVST